MTDPEQEPRETAGSSNDEKGAEVLAGSPAKPDEGASSHKEEEPTGDPVFEAMWAKVVAEWDDDKIHGAILEYSVSGERLPDLAGRYRVLKDDPEKGEKAKKRLDAIIVAATSLMMSMRTPPNTSIPLSITLSVAGLFFAAVAFVAYALTHR